MKKLPIIVTLATVYAILFQASFFVGLSDELIFAMFALSPIIVLYMAYSILKYGKPSHYTFDEKFYDDHAYWRNGREEMDK